MNKIKTQCATCSYFERNDDTENVHGICIKNPPVPVAIPNMNQITGQMGVSIQAVNPPVSGMHCCYSGETNSAMLIN